MKKSALQFFFVLITLLFQYANGQEKKVIANKLSLEQLQEVIDNNYDTLFLKPYLKVYLKKAKEKGDPDLIYKGYENYVYGARSELRLIYADSLLKLAKKTNNNKTIGSAYEAAGSTYYWQKNYIKALDNLLIANSYLETTDEEYIKQRIKYSIATIKSYLGFYDEALTELKSCAVYFKGKPEGGYVNCIESIAICYNRQGNYKLASQYNKIAYNEALKANDSISINYYYFHEGINLYGLKNYSGSVKFIKKSMPTLVQVDDFAGETLANFYLGKNYLALNDHKKAFTYLAKVDEAFIKEKYTRPDLRENYEILINKAKSDGNIQRQLYYVNQLMAADSILNTNFKYLSGKIYKEYDTKKLLAEKKRIEGELAARKTISIVLYTALAILFIASILLLYRYFKNQRIYRHRFEELMVQIENKSAKTDASEPQQATFEQELNTDDVYKGNTTEPDLELKKPDINPEVVTNVLKQLDNFEEKLKFRQKDLTLNDLAASLNTNANYLSKIINYYKQKTFTNYLNNLRIDYIIRILRKNPKFRVYTIKALADEAGFSNPQHFSKAFFAHTGIYPSFFINQMSEVYGNQALDVDSDS